MGNRSECGMFGIGGRDPKDHLWVEGLSAIENECLKDIYLSMNIQC